MPLKMPLAALACALHDWPLFSNGHEASLELFANLQGIKHSYSATNTAETPTLAALQQAVQETDRWYLDYVAGLSAEQLAERLIFTFVDGDTGCMSREEMLAHIVTHGGYHRGAVGRIMAQLQLAPPRDIYTRFLHEDQPQRRAVS
mgnify:CR=1 FL=1